MKNLKLMIVFSLITLTIVSCRNTERERQYASVDAYKDYVDSITKLKLADVSAHWNEIEATAGKRKNEAEAKLRSISDDDKLKEKYQEKIYSATEKYNDFRQNTLSEIKRLEAENATKNLRSTLFQNQTITNDRDFYWVNKDNIANVYDHFVTTVSNNKDSYSREEWHEIKMLYEALDNRKNTVENEGLTAADKRKIAGLKMKFAPMYQINKTEAKMKENKEHKNK